MEIFLPQVLHKDKAKWCPIDYDRDILGSLHWEKVGTDEVVTLIDINTFTEMTAVVGIEGEEIFPEREIYIGENLTIDYFVRRLIDLVPNPWQAARIAGRFIQNYRKNGYDDLGLLKNRIHLSEVLRGKIKEDIAGKAEQIFREKIKEDVIRFQLVTDEKLNYKFQKTIEVSIAEDEKPLSKYGNFVQHSLFDRVFESEFNKLEKNFALYLDSNDSIYWWHKIAARQQYFIQGWRRHRVYPDFIACRKDDNKYLILETKGIHLQGNEDTSYKKGLLKILEATYETALERGEMKTVGENPATFRILLESSWKSEMNEMLTP